VFLVVVVDIVFVAGVVFEESIEARFRRLGEDYLELIAQ
jgi:hypothetical protein